MGSKQFQLEWKVSKEDSGMILREFLKTKQLTKRAITDIKFSGGNLLVNGEKETVRRKLSDGDRVSVLFPEEKPSEGLVPQKIPLDIVHEDEHCIVLAKPAGMATIPSRLYPDGTLANGLLHHLQKQGLSSTIHIVNRLDKDTSGLMLAAKHRFSHSLFSVLQKQAGIQRTYTAIVHGTLKQEAGMIDVPIGRKRDSIIEREVREDGQRAVTHYKVLEGKKEYSLVELKLETGRTHQIRIHMSSIGHPLAGDTLYGGSGALMGRQALNSSVLTFLHPFSKQKMKFETALPEDMRKFWEETDSLE